MFNLVLMTGLCCTRVDLSGLIYYRRYSKLS